MSPLLAATLLLVFTAALPETWKNWRFSRAVVPLAQPAPSGYQSMVLPMAIYKSAQPELQDLRLIDNDGRETPYVIQAQSGSVRREWRTARILDRSFRESQYTYAILDNGEEKRPHNTIELDTGEGEFFARVEVAIGGTPGSDRGWRVVRDKSPIYRFRKDGLEGNQTVHYSETYARYVRVRIFSDGQPFYLAAAKIGQEIVEQAELALLDASFTPETTAKREESSWTGDLGAPTPIEQFQFKVPQRDFHRPVRIFTSVDARQWTSAASGDIYSYGDGEAAQERLQVNTSGARARYWRVVIYNRSDRPLEGVAIQVKVTPRYVVFRPESGRTYRLLYAQERAPAPGYDLARTAPRDAFRQASLATLGAEEANPGYADPRPWTERNPVLIWVALLAAVLAIGGLALRMMKQARPAPAGRE
jgi:hypothetical protein